MCNVQEITSVPKEEFCYVCDSKNDLKCVKRLDSTMLRKCPDSEQRMGCFHTISGKLSLFHYVILHMINFFG